MTNDENVSVLIEAWKFLVGRLPDANITHTDGVATMFGHVPLPFLNLSTPDRRLLDSQELRRALAIARERASSCEHGSYFALCEGWAPEGWEPKAAEEGFTHALNMTGMGTNQLLPPRRALPDLEFRPVMDETTARDLAMVNAQAYGMPPEMVECICNLHLWHEDSFGLVGYSGGRALTSAATFPVDGTIYVGFVATLKEAHGKGYAEAVMRRAIDEAEQAMGKRRMTLHATDMGRPLYQAMGFEPGARVVLLEPSKTSPR